MRHRQHDAARHPELRERVVRARVKAATVLRNDGVRHPGFDVLPPFVAFRTGRVDAERFAQIERDLGERLDTLATTAPIPYHKQNHGAYDIPSLTLKEDIAIGQTGYVAHIG